MGVLKSPSTAQCFRWVVKPLVFGASLVPLALTSTRGMVRRLDAVRWQRLHKLIYVATAAGVVHFWWLVKPDVSEPFVYASILALLLGLRLFWVVRQRSTALYGIARRINANR